MKTMTKAAIVSVLSLVATAAMGTQDQPADIRIDTEAARRTIDALLNPALTREEALSVADLPASRGLVAQAQEFGRKETRESFADQLLAEAHGKATHSFFQFQEVREQAEPVRRALQTIKADPAALTNWVRARIAPFTPAGTPVSGIGYLQVGGPGGGFSIDGGVYVNMSRDKGELGVVRVTLAHELYHGIQHAAQANAGTMQDFKYDAATFDALPNALARQCYATRRLFGSLMEEGTASYVGDIALLPTTGAEALSEREQRELSLDGRVAPAITLLDMGIAAITSPDPVSEPQVYRVGFQQTGQYYYDIGYIMAKAIATHDGSAAFGRLVAQPGDAFVRRYIQISQESGSSLPKLGPNAVRWANRAGC